MNCSHCQKRLSRKSARLIDGVVMCGVCMFKPAKERKPLAVIEARSGETEGLDPKDESANSSGPSLTTQSTTGLVASRIRCAADDPMWADHAEIGKHTLRQAANALSTQDTTIAELVAALEKVDEKLCELSDTKPKREPQKWVDAAEAIEDIVRDAIKLTKSRSAL